MFYVTVSSEVGGLETEPTVLQEVWKQCWTPTNAAAHFVFFVCF